MKLLTTILLTFTLVGSPIYAAPNDSTLLDNTSQSDTLLNDSTSLKNIDSIDTIDICTNNFDYTLDKMVHEWYVENTLAIECKIDSTDIVFYSDSIYISRLQKLPYHMEMPFNSIVKSYIEMYAKRRKQVSYMLGIGEAYYFPMFENSLAKYDVPLELKYLPVIESALNTRAVSPMGAAGLWQFMVATGRSYGLEVNSMVDERKDPIKASDAAARYMADLYKIYGDWHLVIAAYNCGPGNVAKAIRRSGGKRGYWDIYPYLPRETRGYVPIFIAANYIMNYYEEHNICPASPIMTGLADSIMITDRVHLQQIADNIKLPIDELKFLNPQYKYDIIPGDIKSYPLMLPFKAINAYSENRDSILAYKPELAKRQVKVDPAGYKSNGKVKYYKVRNGDYLGKIAERYGVSVSKLKSWNNLHGTMIRVGQTLRIYK